MSKAGGKDGIEQLVYALQRLLPRLAASGAADEGPFTWNSDEMVLGLPRRGGPVLSAGVAELTRAVATPRVEPCEASLDNKTRHAGGRRRAYWNEIRQAYDALPQETLDRLDTEAGLHRCLKRKLADKGIAVSHDTIGRALADHRKNSPQN
jgi:hypothetical protein